MILTINEILGRSDSEEDYCEESSDKYIPTDETYSDKKEELQQTYRDEVVYLKK